MELDDKVCYCFHITKRKILNYLRVHRPRRASQLADCGGAGTGCGWCRTYLQRCFEQQANPAREVASGHDHEPIASDYARQRAAYIRAGHGRPAAGAEPLPPAEPVPPESP